MVKVTVNGICREYENGVTYEKLAQEHQAEYDHRIILAIANGKIKELHKTVDRDAAVTFQTLADRVGHDTYIRSAIMLLIKAISDIAGSPRAGKVSLEFYIGSGYYCIPMGELDEKVFCADGEEAGQIEAGFVEQVRKECGNWWNAGFPSVKKPIPRTRQSRFSMPREWRIRSGCSVTGAVPISMSIVWTVIMTIITAIWCRIPDICNILT